MCMMLDSRLPELMLCGQFTSPDCRGKPRTVWYDVVLSGVQQLKPNRCSHEQPVWSKLVYFACT